MTENGAPPLPFLEVMKGQLEQRRVYALRQDRVRSQRTGREALVDRLFCPDWVNVVAFNEDDELLLVRQWRFGSCELSVEIPAGALERGEDPVAGGLRELVEETGYTPTEPTDVVLLGAVRPNPAFMDNRCFTVFVPRARRTQEQRLDPTEEVSVLTLPRVAIDDALRAGVGACARAATPTPTDVLLDNSLIVAALQLWRAHLNARA